MLHQWVILRVALMCNVLVYQLSLTLLSYPPSYLDVCVLVHQEGKYERVHQVLRNNFTPSVTLAQTGLVPAGCRYETAIVLLCGEG